MRSMGTIHPTLSCDIEHCPGDRVFARRIVRRFAPRPLAAPNMKIAVEQGHVLHGTTLTEVDPQVVGPFAPTSSVRVDRVVVDAESGLATRLAGTDGSIEPPAIPAGTWPIARVVVTAGTAAITAAAIADERAFDPVCAPVPTVVCRIGPLPMTDEGPTAGVVAELASADVLVPLDATNTSTIVVGGMIQDNRFLPGSAGYYSVVGAVQVRVPVNSEVIARARLVRGDRTVIGNAYVHNFTTSNAVYALPYVADIMFLDAGQAIELRAEASVRHADGTSKPRPALMAENTRLMVHRVGGPLP